MTIAQAGSSRAMRAATVIPPPASATSIRHRSGRSRRACASASSALTGSPRISKPALFSAPRRPTRTGSSESARITRGRCISPTVHAGWAYPGAVSWEPELQELRRREELARRMGGEERVERQRASGRLTVRERVERLVDPGTFHERGALAGAGRYEDGELVDFVPANMVVGWARLGGRRVALQADDFTVRGGAADAAIWEKGAHAERIAHDMRIPLVRLVDGTGGGGSVKSLEQMGFSYVPPLPGFDLVVRNLAIVPVVAAALGPVAGLGAARVAASHFSVMVRGSSQLFVAGPPVVNRAFGGEVEKEELGGSHIHAHGSGAVDNEVQSEQEAFDHIRRFLSY